MYGLQRVHLLGACTGYVPAMLLIVAAALACDRASTVLELEDAVVTGLRAYEQMDAVPLRAAAAAADAALGCLAAAPPREDLAALHLLHAMVAFVDHDDSRVGAALAGAFASRPGYQLPVDLVPDQDPLRAFLPGAQALLDHAEPVPLERGWQANGGPTRLAGVAAIVWRGAGPVTDGRYVWPGQTLPAPVTPHHPIEGRVALAANVGNLGLRPNTDLASGFLGAGAELGVGMSWRSKGIFGFGGELDYRGVLVGGTAHGAWLRLGPDLRLGPIDVDAGPSFGWMWATGSTGATDVEGDVRMIGAAGRLAWRVSRLALRLDGGAWWTGERDFEQLGLGVELQL